MKYTLFLLLLNQLWPCKTTGNEHKGCRRPAAIDTVIVISASNAARDYFSPLIQRRDNICHRLFLSELSHRPAAECFMWRRKRVTSAKRGHVRFTSRYKYTESLVQGLANNQRATAWSITGGNGRDMASASHLRWPLGITPSATIGSKFNVPEDGWGFRLFSAPP